MSLFVWLLLATAAAGEPEGGESYRTVVSASRETPEGEEGRAVTVISASQIEKKRKETVGELLRETPGIHVATSGGAGGLTTLFLRGGKGGHALVLLDGVRLNDPFSVENAADLSDILTDGISRIEILRGPHAVIYGPDALSGVVRIITVRGKGTPYLSLFSETGLVDMTPADVAVNHLRLGGAFGGTRDRGDYRLDVSYRDTGGYSAAAEQDGNHEEDRARTLTLAGRFTVRPTDAVAVSALIRRIGSDADIDNGPGPYRDDPNHSFATERLLGRVAAEISLFSGKWRQETALSMSRHTANDRNPPDGTQDERGFMRTFFAGETLELSWRHEVTALPLQRLETGLSLLWGNGAAEWQMDRTAPVTLGILPRRETLNAGLYLFDTLAPCEDITLSFGGRGDLFFYRRHGTTTDPVGTEVLTGERLVATGHGTYSVAAAYRIAPTDTTLRTSVATAFKPPSLFQLYSAYGSEFLKAEETFAVDGGIEQRLWERRILIELTGFYQETKNAIEFSYGCDGTLCGRYQNRGWITAAGIESAFSARPHHTLTVSGSYTFTVTDAFDVVHYDGRRFRDSRPVLRRPMHLASLWFDWNPHRLFNANAGLTVVGPRRDIAYRYPYEPVVTTLPTALLSSLVVTIRPTPKVRFYGRIENLLDRHDEMVEGFGVPGLSCYLGLVLDIGGAP